MKSAEQWFDQCLEAPIASRAKSYLEEDVKIMLYKSAKQALMYSFEWAKTLEGWAYWSRIADKLQ